MTDNELFHLLALLKIEGVGDIMAKKLIAHCGSAEKVFQAKPNFLKNIDGVGKGLLQNFKNPSVFVLAKNEMDYINKNNISCCSYLEENYPD